MSDEVIKPPDKSLAPTPGCDSKRMYLAFNGDCLKQDKITYDHGKIVNIYIVYDLKSTLNYNPDFNLQNCLLGTVEVTRNTDANKCKYFGYGIGFDGKGDFSYPTGSFGNNAMIFGADMSSSVHIDNKKKDLLILGKGQTQRLGQHSLTAEKMYSINFSATKRRFCLSLRNNGTNSYLFVNDVEIIKFKAKGSEIIPNVLCLGNVSKDFSVSNMKKTKLYGTAYDFSVDYGAISIDDILSINKYLIRKHNIV